MAETKNEINEDFQNLLVDEWMVRPCKMYYEEYKDCRSIRARLHQYFIYGEPVDCSQWRRDYDNCCKWTGSKDVKAFKEIVVSETDRRISRLKGHYANDVWEKRDSTPEGWNDPLPEKMQQEYESSYLYAKVKMDKEEGINNKSQQNGQKSLFSSCAIS